MLQARRLLRNAYELIDWQDAGIEKEPLRINKL